MPKRTLNLDEELFVKALCRAVEDGDASFVDGHVGRLDGLVDKLRDCLRELSTLQNRARLLHDRTQAGRYESVFAAPPAIVGRG
jgi:hypothetical protein